MPPLSALVATGLLMLCSSAPASGNLVTNGDFQTGDFSGWVVAGSVYATIPAGGGSLAAVFNASDQPPNGSIYQTIQTTPGKYYRVDFDFGVVTYWPSTQSLELVVAGAAGGTLSRIVTDPTPGGPVTLEHYAFAFQASGALVRLSFEDVSTNWTASTDAVVDNVSMVETASLVVSGDFETGDFSGWGASGNVGATVPFGGGSLAAVFNPSDSPPNGQISQVIPTMAGVKYRVDFDYGVLTYWPADQTLWFRVASTEGTIILAPITDPSPSGPVTLVHYSWEFYGEGNSTLLEFWDDAGNFTTATDGVLDNVTVVSKDIVWLPGLTQSSVAWGDYDGDGDLDLALSGNTATSRIARIYRNSGGADPTFTDIGAGLPGVWSSSVAWGDYDNDQDLDLLLSGTTSVTPPAITRIYRNGGGADPTFTNIGVGALPAVCFSSSAWGDYDNDGDLDILLTGAPSQVEPGSSWIYRNEGGGDPTFTDIGAGLQGVRLGSVAWGDYDNDGDLDILLTGAIGTSTQSTAHVYRNSGGANPTFTDIGAGLPGVYRSSVAWGDYDNDGDLDILLTGMSQGGRIARIYRNNGGLNPTFSFVRTVQGVDDSAVAWGDYDNDGDLDIVLTGHPEILGVTRFSRIYENSGGADPTFAETGTELPGVNNSAVAWSDYDGDGDLDLLLTGEDAAYQTFRSYTSRIYRRSGVPSNTPPSAPTGLASTIDGNQVTLSWTASTDAQSPSAGLHYNLRLGTTPGGSEISSAMAGANGYRQIVAHGNAQKRTSWTLTRPGPGTGPIYWSVQAIDGAWAGSPFATNATVDVAETGKVMFGARVSPNPLSGSGVLSFATTVSGRVRVDLYDTKGRRVRRLMNDHELTAGPHSLALAHGTTRLPAGLYFYKITAAEGELTGKFVVVQ